MNGSTGNGTLTVIILFMLMHTPYICLAQDGNSISINEKNISLSGLISHIETNTRYSIAYNKSAVDLAKTVSVSAENEPVEKVLSKALDNTKLTYKVQGYHIIISPDRRKAEPEKKIETPVEIPQEEEEEPVDENMLYLQIDVDGNVHVTTAKEINPEAVEIYPIYIEPKKPAPPFIYIKNNLLQDAALACFASFNLGLEVRLSEKLTLDFPVSFNPWTFSGNRKFKHFVLQPEVRYWFDKPFTNYFVGVHAHWSSYDVANIALFTGEDFRYDGWLAGGGISGGYRWDINKKWGLETTLGIGYAHFSHNKYNYQKGGEFLGKEHMNRFGLTKAGISISYRLK